MPTRQLASAPVPCRHPEHEPPIAQLAGGIYEHDCPGCGRRIQFTVEVTVTGLRVLDENEGSAGGRVLDLPPRITRLVPRMDPAESVTRTEEPSARSAMFCEHANECPQSCPCDADCYCKTHTCKPRTTTRRSRT